MEQGSIVRFLAIGGLVALFVLVVWPKLSGDSPKPPSLEKPLAAAPGPRKPEQLCLLKGNRYTAELSTHGATLKAMRPEGAKYTEGGKPMNLVTTPDHESKRPLSTELRRPGADTQVAHDLLDWSITSQTGKECVFSYRDDKVELTKTVKASERPFELDAELVVKNVGASPAKHRASFESASWFYEHQVKGGFGRQSPWVSQLECLAGGKVEEFTINEFSPKDFAKPEFKEGWRVLDGPVGFASTSNFYFTQALVPIDGPAAASCELQVQKLLDPTHASDDKASLEGAFYRSRLAYPVKELSPGEATTYKVTYFSGPKERDVLAQAGGGNKRLSELIRLGTFAFIAKLLVLFLVKVQGVVGSWGISIIILTLAVRTLLFPLTWKQIQSGAKMREMKPELDAINEKYADDPQQKQLATLELWRKHDVNPMAGCLPTLVQMPVWFALYTTLQTAAELFHTPFLWFTDLSAPDTRMIMGHEVPFILPWLLGGTSFLQQKLMPMQMDPVQQRMMTYMMPAIFTAMMLFLPSGLGVYMFTNSVLGIVQQLAVERYYASRASKGTGGGGEIAVREKKA